jgi:transcriptional regulator with XRE-family HTH domain
MTQAELARKSELAVGTVQQYELRKRKPSFDALMSIAKVFNIDISELNEAVPDRKGLELVAPPPDPDPREAELLGNFHQLNEAGQEQLVSYSNFLLMDDRNKKDAERSSS